MEQHLRALPLTCRRKKYFYETGSRGIFLPRLAAGTKKSEREETKKNEDTSNEPNRKGKEALGGH